MGQALSRYRDLSLWHATLSEGIAAADDLVPRAPLDGDTVADVAIIGAGLTGLWTAYYLSERDRALRIVVLDKEIAGFGASGRNGGWCSALFPRSTASLERAHGREPALAMRRAMIDTVDEVGRVSGAEGIDCDFIRGGTLAFARSEPQLSAARADVAEAVRYGVDELELREGGRGPIGTRAVVFDPACARIHPAKLVRGLARTVAARGVTIAEETEALDWEPGTVRTRRGNVTAQAVIQATEGYGATLTRTHRAILPLYSLMIATEPLPDSFWRDAGIEHGQTFTDYRHLLIYGQRTADNRFAFGGRGARYHWGSAIRSGYDRSPRVFEHLRRTLVELFPAAADARVTHRWGGPIGVPRDWHASVRFDPVTGLGSAGGYVGDGLSTTNLAGRTLADLVTGTDSALVSLPWVNHESPSWEPEPLRFVGANLGLAAMGVADVEENLTRRASVVAKLMAPLVGH
ncbi:MAG: FAD-dependent oxidoreductase [Microbacteriaceae bacterium]|jgi:glycine/D-amino acid oxidase-like deaminating enzyme|nr:FAD-dependent oxidoreductase [Microbacteriaceae bacterium]HEV7957738.1 FAD-binding oxidoreductase [Marisediminicola sp.]